LAQAAQGDADALSLLRVAHDTLRDPQRRAAYDRRLAARAEPGPAPGVLSGGLAGELPPHLSRSSRPRRSRLRNWLVLALAIGGSAAYLLLSSPPPPPPAVLASVAPPAPVEVRRAEADEDVADASDEANSPPPAPVDAGGVAPVAAPPVPPAGQFVAEVAVPKRPAKQPGFDGRYLAWSVYTVRQRNKTGSGVLIAPDRILTNCHVLAGGASNGLIVVHGLTGRTTKVEKYARLDGEDACLLLAPGVGDESVAWGDSASLRPGDTVHAMGHPGGSTAVAWSEGTVHLRTERGGQYFIISDNYCRPGSSGGPLLDAEGRLVGIVTAVQRYQAKGGEAPRFGACISVTEATARALLARPLFPIALAPAQYFPD
ncbi:MAG TPA: serine protease, partial [Azospira sp.]|nr:serine protease [Azospira sp.]